MTCVVLWRHDIMWSCRHEANCRTFVSSTRRAKHIRYIFPMFLVDIRHVQWNKKYWWHMHRWPCRSRPLDHYTDHFYFSYYVCWNLRWFLFPTCSGGRQVHSNKNYSSHMHRWPWRSRSLGKLSYMVLWNTRNLYQHHHQWASMEKIEFI